MSRRTISLAGTLALALTSLAIFLPAPAAAASSPAWQLSATSQPTNFIAGSSGKGHYILIATNVGSAPATEAGGEVTITDILPAGLSPVNPVAESKDPATAKFTCTTVSQAVTCKSPGPVHPGFMVWADIPVNVTAPEGSALTDQAEVSGGGALSTKASTVTRVSSSTPPFGFLPSEEGFKVPMIDEDGLPAVQAGSHPYGATVDLNFPTVAPGGFLTSAGHLRDLKINLPPGVLANPAATPTRCTEAELSSEGNPGCPNSSQIGTVTLTTFVLGVLPEPVPLYNMVPPPGAPAAFAFDALNVGIFPHVIASIRSESDYGATGTTSDILARGLNPILDIGTELWGDPSSSDHDFARECPGPEGTSCKVEPQSNSLLSLPGSCSEAPLSYATSADSWEEPAPQFPEAFAEYKSADLEGNPVALDGCNQLKFEPTISVSPTTNLAESPSGLDVDLHQPQDFNLGSVMTAQLKDATVTLPSGLSVNPSQADGLGVCTPSQVGMLTEVGQSPAHFSAEPSSCPASATLGTVEVTSPLLAQYEDAGTKVTTNPETGQPLPEPLHGSVYLAKPFDNPFGSLLAIYLTVEDPKTGIFAKLAGRVIPDPQTGQLTTRFEENPQLPLEDVRLHLFGGARGSLITPPTCGAHTTSSDLTPWSTPEGADARPASSFQTTGEPGGGACPTSEGAAANKPAFSAGTISPQAGAYSPFVLKISREDGSQRLTGIDTTLPEGLTGKLAGIPECGGAQIAQAESRSRPEEGRLERESPSCPAASEVGTVVVGAGAGPTPLYTTGHAYLAGPYKGAPLSLAVIVPAIAGPFDLGTVVTRVALHLESETTQIHAVSDPLPTILDGIPLDIRSVALRMGRPGFTLNPTSCEPLAITGVATSSLGQAAALNQRFQVGGCSALPFRPKLSLRLKGKVRRTAHPTLIANLKAKEGEANIGRAQVKLPHSVFLDQGHIKTVCTRVQFAAASCPAGSIYGSAEATSPLLGYPISGPVYLRSSSHELPDLVAQLKGPASQPIEIDLDGKTDSVKGALRNTFEAVPDAPVSTFHLELFGGKRGLVEMSSGFCAAPKATVKLTAHSGKIYDTTPAVAAKCPKVKKGKAHHRKGAHGKRGGGK
jgi:uncharacterized repeat protein (TIGR01451 family)